MSLFEKLYIKAILNIKYYYIDFLGTQKKLINTFFINEKLG